jgi:CHASE2 domain-containing sensor protein
VKHARRSLLAGSSNRSTKNKPPEKSVENFSWAEFGKHYRKAIVWIVILTAVVHVMEVSGVLKGFEMAGLDTFLRLHARQMSERVVIVEITNEDYKDPQLFDGKSPLNNEQLLKLVSSIQAYHPAVIGMDFDTNSEDWCHIDSSRLANVLPPTENTGGASPIVWAEVPDNLEEPLKLSPVLGGMLQDPRYAGIPRFPVDSDGLVRRYESKFLVAGSLESCPRESLKERDHSSKLPETSAPSHTNTKSDEASMHSFARTILQHACTNPGMNCSTVHQDSDHTVIFNFYGDRYRFPIIQSREFIGPSADAPSPDQNIRDRRKALLKDKIVLIGGNFSAARDVYMTPLGEMAGVELIALAIESDFGGGIRETQKWLEKLADLVVGTLIVLIYFYYRRRPRLALALSLIGIPFVATTFSLLLFRTAAYWFNFAPIIIGMVLHQMLELSESCGELQEEVHDLERQLHACRETASPTEAPGAEPTIPNDAAPTKVGSPPPEEEPKISLSDRPEPPR